jgi:hypothetical protein
LYGAPGPLHATECPSPIDHDTDVGVAVAVTDSPATAAGGDLTATHGPCNHNHVGIPTYVVAAAPAPAFDDAPSLGG